MCVCVCVCVWTLCLCVSSAYARDASSNPHQNVTASNTGVPVGTIIAWPLGSMPRDAEKWLECNGAAVPATYPELRRLMASTPNLNQQFLRGTTSASKLLTTSQDSIKDHVSSIPDHRHPYSGNLDNKNMTGTAEGQKFTSDIASWDLAATAAGQKFTSDTATWNLSATAAGQKFTSDTASWSLSATAAGQKFTSNNATWNVTGSAAGQTYQKAKINGSSGVKYVGQWAHVGDGGTEALCSGPTAVASGNPSLSYDSVAASSSSLVNAKASGTVSGTAQSSTVTGTASGKVSGTAQSSTVTGTASGKVSGTAQSSTVTGKATGKVTGTAQKSNVSGSLISGHFSGYTENVSLSATYKDPVNGSETAPKHIYVRYLIRARS